MLSSSSSLSIYTLDPALKESSWCPPNVTSRWAVCQNAKVSFLLLRLRNALLRLIPVLSSVPIHYPIVLFYPLGLTALPTCWGRWGRCTRRPAVGKNCCRVSPSPSSFTSGAPLIRKRMLSHCLKETTTAQSFSSSCFPALLLPSIVIAFPCW